MRTLLFAALVVFPSAAAACAVAVAEGSVPRRDGFTGSDEAWERAGRDQFAAVSTSGMSAALTAKIAQALQSPHPRQAPTQPWAIGVAVYLRPDTERPMLRAELATALEQHAPLPRAELQRMLREARDRGWFALSVAQSADGIDYLRRLAAMPSRLVVDLLGGEFQLLRVMSPSVRVWLFADTDHSPGRFQVHLGDGSRESVEADRLSLWRIAVEHRLRSALVFIDSVHP